MILLLMGNKYIIGPEWPRINLPAWFRCVRETDGSARWLVEKSSNTHAQAHAY